MLKIHDLTDTQELDRASMQAIEGGNYFRQVKLDSDWVYKYDSDQDVWAHLVYPDGNKT